MFKTIRAAGVTAAALFLCANASQASAQTAATAIPTAATVSPSVHAAAPAQVSSAATNVTATATNAATPAVAIVHASADTSLTPAPARDGDQIVTPQGFSAIVGRDRPDRSIGETVRPVSGLSLAALVEQHAAAESGDEQFQCLASAVYFESRGEPLEGQLAVAEVILNRVASGRFRSTVCDVVTQPSQFSFVRGGRIPEPNRASAAWSRAVAIARIAMDNLHDVTGDDSLFFHATYVRPSWGRPSARIARIGNHIFYR